MNPPAEESTQSRLHRVGRDPSGVVAAALTSTRIPIQKQERKGALARWLDGALGRVPPEARRRGQAVLVGLLGACLFSLIDLVVHRDGVGSLRSLVDLGGLIVFGVALLLLVVVGSIDGAVSLGLIVIATAIGVDFMHSGDPYFLAFLVMLPPLAAILAGRRLVLVTSIAAAVLVVVLVNLSYPILGMQEAASYVDAPSVEAVTLCLALLVIGGVSWWSERMRDEEIAHRSHSDRLLDVARRRLELVAAAGFDLALESDEFGTIEQVGVAVGPDSLGYDNDMLVGRSVTSLVHPDDADRLAIARDGLHPVHTELRLRRQDGGWSWVRIVGGGYQAEDGRPRIFFGVRRIDDERAAARRLVDVQKLEGVAQLAGSVAHDFKNLLTVIYGWTELLDASEAQQQIQDAASQASTLTNHLLAFGRRHDQEEELVDLNQLVRDASPVLRSLVSEEIELEVDLAEADCWVMANSSQLGQVLINLATNSRDALRRGGRLTIRTAVREFDGETAARHGVVPGEYVSLVVTDTGEGMSDETKRRALEPFFTTKEAGQGTGLGLASVNAVARQGHGAVAIESSEGSGTSVIFWLPRCLERRAPRPEVESFFSESARPTEKHGRVLLVEDQEEIRQLTCRVLEGAGLEVASAASGDEALSALVDLGAIDLLVTDVVMPGMRGPELAVKLREQRADLNVLFVSGYTDCDIDLGSYQHAETRFLAKPYRPKELLSVIEELL